MVASEFYVQLEAGSLMLRKNGREMAIVPVVVPEPLFSTSICIRIWKLVAVDTASLSSFIASDTSQPLHASVGA